MPTFVRLRPANLSLTIFRYNPNFNLLDTIFQFYCKFQALRDHCTVHSRGELNLYTKKRKRAHRVGKNQIPPYLCSLCKSEFVRPVEYSSHISQDHGVELMAGEAIFTCNHCFESYGSLLDLNEHLEKHPEAHKYPCSKCSMTFAVFNARNHHLVTVDIFFITAFFKKS